MPQVKAITFDGRSIVLHRSREDVEFRGTLILLHGYGADEYDLISLYNYLDPSLDILSIRGPRLTPYGGASWFDIEMSINGDLKFNAEQALESAGNLLGTVTKLRQEGVIRKGKIILGGFSQGASIAMIMAIQAIRDFTALLLMSGRVTDRLAGPDSNSDSFRNLPVFIGHGVRDEIIPIDFGRKVRLFWEKLSERVIYHEYPIGHEISGSELEHIRDWMQDILVS